jgi:hypothetical protein
MTTSAALSYVAIASATVAAGLYLAGLWRRWRPGPDGRPSWMSSPQRFREPWVVAALAFLIMAVIAQAVSKLV